MKNTPHTHQRFRPQDYLKLTILGLALGAVANGMHSLILPMRVQELVGPELKATYLGVMTFCGLIVAMLTQPVFGAVSDNSRFKWGRRKPFILAGTVLTVGLMLGIGAGSSYASLFIVWCLIQGSLNTTQGPFQALIPDQVPADRRGIASGVKNLLEILGAVLVLQLIGKAVGSYAESTSGNSWLWISLGLLTAMLIITAAVTLIFVKERPGAGKQDSSWLKIILTSFNVNVKTNSSFVLFLFSRLLFLMALTMIQSFALYFFQDVVGVSNPAKITADLITVVGICLAISVYPAGYLSDRIGRKPILMSCGLLAALGTAIIYLTTEYAVIIVGGCVIGLGAGAFLSVNWALATDLIPRSEAARYMGLTNLASAGGGALARLIGPVIDYFNQFGEGLGYSVMLAVCFIFFISSAILIWRIKTAPPLREAAQE
jgi:Na+/melibiose symporter-like transporter